jgi:hypothetical protein
MITMRKLNLSVGVVLLAALFAGCSDSGNEPNPTNSVSVSLTTPNTDDGALLMVFTGPRLSNFKPASAAYQLFWRATGPNETRVIVVGDIAAGILFTATADGAPSGIGATVGEVSTRSDQLRGSTAGYTLAVSR